jgi:hypothetical protein
VSSKEPVQHHGQVSGGLRRFSKRQEGNVAAHKLEDRLRNDLAVILVGDTEESLLKKLGLDRIVSGSEVFSKLDCDYISSDTGAPQRVWEALSTCL